MTTFLLTWKSEDKPGYWNYDDLNREITIPFKENGAAEPLWRTKSHKKAKVGDKVLLLKQGARPTGIFGAGVIIAPAERVSEPGSDKLAYRVKIRVTKFVDPAKEFFLNEKRSRKILGDSLVDVRTSGCEIPAEKAMEAFKIVNSEEQKIKDALSDLFQEDSKITQSGFTMLFLHYGSPNQTISMEKLANECGCDRHTTANAQYGKFAHKFADKLNINLPQWMLAIATVSPEKDEHGHDQWVLRQEISEALESLGFVDPRDSNDSHEDIEILKNEFSGLSKTEQTALIKARIGQGRFRTNLIKHWNRRCSVTNNTVLSLLIASHIRPWCHSDNTQRLDEMNGLLLLPNLDKAFDKGLISFNDDGTILISSRLSKKDIKSLGIRETLKLRWVKSRQKEYLKYHREERFKP